MGPAKNRALFFFYRSLYARTARTAADCCYYEGLS